MRAFQKTFFIQLGRAVQPEGTSWKPPFLTLSVMKTYAVQASRNNFESPTSCGRMTDQVWSTC